MSNFAQTSEDWDDTLILQVFNNAIARHSTKKQQGKPSRDSREQDKNDIDEVTGKRKREEQTPPPKLSLKGMLDSYSARKRSGAEKNPTTTQVPAKEKSQKVHFHFPSEESDVLSSSSAPPSSSHFVEAEAEPTTAYPSMFTNYQPSQSMHPLVNDALQNMLMAWYHSGYATGRYEALLELNHLLQAVPPQMNSDEQQSNQR